MPKKSLCLLIVVALLVYVATLFFNMPGAVVVRQLKLPGVQLLGVQGSLYQGQIAQVMWRGQSLGKLHWQLAPWALLKGRVNEQVSVDGRLSGSLDLYQSMFSKGVNNLHLTFSGQSLSELTSLPVKIQGQFKVTVSKWALSGRRCQRLNGQIHWLQPQLSTLLGRLNLSPIQLEMSCSKGHYVAKVNHQGAMLVLQGNAQLSGARWQVDLQARPTEHFPKRLRVLLDPLGAPSPDGFYSFRTTGVF
ncbi:type II secretion system protein N [Celerinatantimonas diazotrophica]|uniref:Type II secretion system protein N n=1 Tax=Celerinatantimonas diazotrophica TaxID=412034 RepID=A0A4R1KDV4_9GAMM|nr:type II secretion system protein N [Celerinatantimonas diazotrophica]TCK62744.1 type II secretion system protein N (GspN) [Celerinatantimonas diazotrophica]CAG9298374.1 hypothetical protein CEDIAZO_03574 [Celerinatantimonas diazotrophica]